MKMPDVVFWSPKRGDFVGTVLAKHDRVTDAQHAVETENGDLIVVNNSDFDLKLHIGVKIKMSVQHDPLGYTCNVRPAHMFANRVPKSQH